MGGPGQLQRADVLVDSARVRRVGDQSDVAVGADEDQSVGAVCMCHVSAVVEEAAWSDQVRLDDVAEPGGAPVAEAEQREVRSAEKVEQAEAEAEALAELRGIDVPAWQDFTDSSRSESGLEDELAVLDRLHRGEA